MSRSGCFLSIAMVLCCAALACSSGTVTTSPSAAAVVANQQSSASGGANATAAEPPFNLEAILRGDGFGHVEFRQDKNPDANIINLGVWVRDLAPNTSYSLQRAVDTVLDGACTGTNWLTLGLGPIPQPIVTDEKGTGSVDLWRDLSAFAPGTAFDIHFRVLQTDTTIVVLQSDCYRFVVRD